MIDRFVMISISIIILTCFPGCQTTKQPAVKATSVNNLPDWLRSEPKVEGMICAIGTSGPTFYKEDAQQYAADNARTELAKTIQVKIESILIDFATEKGSSIDEATVAQVTSSATSAIVQNSKVVDYWYDEEGTVARERDITFALCCMPRKLYKTSLAGRLINLERQLDQDEINKIISNVIEKFEEGK
jgi:hypothetical protein